MYINREYRTFLSPAQENGNIMNILIIDDEPVSRRLLKAALSKFGFCKEVMNGREALDAFYQAHKTNKPYTLICIDIKMPEINGHEVLSEIRGVEIGISKKDIATIFMVTGSETRKDVFKAFYQGGCDDYIVKPITRETVYKKLLEHKLIK